MSSAPAKEEYGESGNKYAFGEVPASKKSVASYGYAIGFLVRKCSEVLLVHHLDTPF